MSEVEMEVVRAILEAMCRKQQISLVSAFGSDEPAANYVLAQRLGIGSVFGIPDNEEKLIEVAFSGGPWDGQKISVEHFVGPVFGVGHAVGSHYWLDSKGRGTPTYHWDGTAWETK